MREYIRKLRSKKESTRKRLLTTWMVISMFVVGSVWILGLGNHFNQKVAMKTRDDVRPFKLFANSISKTYKNITASVGNIPSLKKDYSNQENKKQIDLEVVEPNDN